jgi:hypothetical protein
MQYLLVFLLTFLLTTSLSAQILPKEYGIKIVFQDSIGQVDSIRFGPYSNINGPTPTLETDTIFGETTNLVGQPLNNLDIRIVQRDSMNHICLTDAGGWNAQAPFYFPNNRAAKVDIRPLIYGTNASNGKQNFASAAFIYEISIHASHYPLTVSLFLDNTPPTPYSEFYLLEDSCQIDTSYLYSGVTTTETFTITDSSIHTILAYLSHEVAISKIEDISNTIHIYPNPVQENIQIQMGTPLSGQLTLLNTLGQTIKTYPITEQLSFQIDLHGLKNGIYFLQYLDNTLSKMAVKKIIKQ